MNTAKLRSRNVVLPVLTAVAAFGISGAVWATTASADLQGSERDRVGNAATQAVGGGDVTEVESSDDPGEAYEVEVRRPDGTEVDVDLDQKLNVVSQDVDDRDDDGDRDDSDADDRVLSAAERSSAEEAAVSAVGGGTVTDVEASDDPGEAYEVEVRAADNTEWDVELDADFTVLRKHVDD